MGKGGSQTVGYAYRLDFAYTFCERIDELYRFFRNGTEEWPPEDYAGTGVPTSFLAQTGTVGTVYGSNSGKSSVKVYGGTQASIPEMSSWTGLNIGYLNTCTLVFNQAFVGDNVQTIPKYSIIAGNNTYTGISNYKELPDGNANPVDIIYNILVRDLQMDTTMIDEVSFQAAAWTVYDEGLGVGLVMGTTRNVMSWIEDQLLIIDGVLFVDNITNRLKLKLLRDDYILDNLVILDDTNMAKATMENVSWAETYNKFVFKYTYLYTGKETAVEFINTAARQALGYDRIKTITFPSINSGAVLNKVATRIVNKSGTPLAGLKAVVDYIDFPNINIGDAIKFTSTKLGVTERVFRVMRITGDNEENPTINIECIEDIFAKSYAIEIPDSDGGHEYVPPDYTISPPKRVMAKDAQREMAVGDALVWLATKGDESDFVLGANCSQIGGFVSTDSTATYATLATVIPQDIRGLNGALTSSLEYNREYEFQLNDVDGSLFEYFGSDNTLQNLRHVGYIGDEEFSFKSLEDLGGGTFLVTGVMRGLNDTSIVSHAVGEPVFIGPSDGRFTSILPINNSTPSLQFYNHNHINVSGKVNLNPTYTFTTSKPYNPVPVQTGFEATRVFSWRPRVALSGANYRNEDKIVAGEDEGKVTGYYEITFPDSSTVNVYPSQGDTLITQETTQTGTHYVKHISADTHRYDTSMAIFIY